MFKIPKKMEFKGKKKYADETIDKLIVLDLLWNYGEKQKHIFMLNFNQWLYLTQVTKVVTFKK